MKYASVIDDELWDQAHWVATAFAFPPIEGGIPALALAFEQERSAVKIFNSGTQSLGQKIRMNVCVLPLLRVIFLVS